jgi:signal transduction histidine kinase
LTFVPNLLHRWAVPFPCTAWLPPHCQNANADAFILIGRDVHKKVLDIASDIQSLSHELHSSKLKYLGLVAAMKIFCKEFAERQNVQVDFQSYDVPRTLPGDISLCLFRVLQESLQNSAKYSGVRNFEARLWAVSAEIHLSVRDTGRGFSLAASRRSAGLGLVSMQECEITFSWPPESWA